MSEYEFEVECELAYLEERGEIEAAEIALEMANQGESEVVK
jgi:hypothetical protein